MIKNSEQQDRFLEELCRYSEEVSLLMEKLEREGRRAEDLTESESRRLLEIDKAVTTIGLQLDESLKEQSLTTETMDTELLLHGLRV
ncbi:hypothetical protein [uncultured Mailhella sp.]|uniref:hypothetical protein n=1 Tax=uncultured Mailhella sp. TaxID=1981031 RepID=UPI0025F89B66|nr:hypothetical protein [uncultured Mailhella sp.]